MFFLFPQIKSILFWRSAVKEVKDFLKPGYFVILWIIAIFLWKYYAIFIGLLILIFRSIFPYYAKKQIEKEIGIKFTWDIEEFVEPIELMKSLEKEIPSVFLSKEELEYLNISGKPIDYELENESNIFFNIEENREKRNNHDLVYINHIKNTHFIATFKSKTQDFMGCHHIFIDQEANVAIFCIKRNKTVYVLLGSISQAREFRQYISIGNIYNICSILINKETLNWYINDNSISFNLKYFPTWETWKITKKEPFHEEITEDWIKQKTRELYEIEYSWLIK